MRANITCPPLTASKQRTFSVEGIGPLPRSIVDTTRGDHDCDLSTVLFEARWP
jgi:hypothetical protein